MDKEAAVAIDIYDGHVPSFIEDELEQLYGARYACVEYFRVYQGLEGVCAYRVACGGKPQVILLYQHRHHTLWVLNQAISIDAEQLQRFTECMFARHPQVRRIDFHSIDADASGLHWPKQCLLTREDTVAALPVSVDEYLASLGKSTRHNLRRYRERLLREHPGFELRVVPRQQIGSEHLHLLQMLNRERLDSKGRLSTIDDTELHRLRQLSARYGMVTLACIGDKVVGGMLCFIIGKGITFRIIAHDPSYDDYSLGFLIYFMTICEAIRQGCTQMNFGWDYYPYKLRLGGQRRRLAMLTLYRSRLAYAMDASSLLLRQASRLRQEMAAALREAAASGSPHARLVQALAGNARRLLHRSAQQS